jgi:hypothetical protein
MAAMEGVKQFCRLMKLCEIITAFCLGLAAIAALPARAQQPGAQERSLGLTIRLNTDLVMIDVTATDKSGNYIRDLRAEEIQVFEDGQQRNVNTRQGRPVRRVVVVITDGFDSASVIDRREVIRRANVTNCASRPRALAYRSAQVERATPRPRNDARAYNRESPLVNELLMDNKGRRGSPHRIGTIDSAGRSK